MRKRIVKGTGGGRGSVNRKEVALRTNKAGLNADGSQRWSIAVRFTADSFKKASDTGFVAVEIDDELKRLYFVPASSKEGYKLTGSSKGNTFKNITFSVKNVEEWEEYEGDYDLLKDVKENLYYIDLREGKKK